MTRTPPSPPGRGIDIGDDIGDPTLERVLRVAAGWGVPALVTGAWLFLAITSDASLIGKALMGLGLVIVLLLWGLIRKMMLHAALTRALAVGNAERALELALGQLARTSRPVARVPFEIYVALAYELRGEWPEVLAALEPLTPVRGTSWHVLATAAQIAALIESGERARAAELHAAELAPVAAGLTGDVRALAQLAEARVRWASDDHAAASALLAPLMRDPRTPTNIRAIANRYAARIAAAAGDAESAARHAARAASIAPGTWAGDERASGLGPQASTVSGGPKPES